jgi:hypothetical protein
MLGVLGARCTPATGETEMKTAELIALATAQYDAMMNPRLPEADRNRAAFAHDKNMEELDRRAANDDREAQKFLM